MNILVVYATNTMLNQSIHAPNITKINKHIIL